MEEFKLSTLATLEDEAVIERYRLIFEPMFKTLLDPVTQKLTDTVQALSQTVQVLKKEGEEKEKRIQVLEREITHLKLAIDNHEQHGRRDSIRIFGLSEQTSGSTDDKVLRLCNERMRIQPPLSLEEISVSHRVGIPKDPVDGNPPQPRPLLVKFATRRSKERVMAAKKKLHNRRGGRTGRPPPRPAAPRRTTSGEGDGSDDGDGDASDDGDGGQHVDGLNGDEDQVLINMNWPDGVNIYISDDLTKTRANLAYQARQAKRAGKLTDTWVIGAKIMIKDNYMRISQVTCAADLADKIK